ncbi:hypothetical protein HQ520_05845 [bacterium]|nr:hypothetical protein [bacterium]
MQRRIAATLAMLGLVFWCGIQTGRTEPANQKDQVVKILRTTNKAQTNRFVCAALEFKNVNPYNLVNFFWSATSREEGGVYSFSHPDGNSGYLVVICPEYQLPSLRQLAKDLDRPGVNSGPGSKYIYYRMQHRNIADPSFRAAASWYLGQSGLLVPDQETNSVLIFDAATGASTMEKALIEYLDKPLRQTDLGVKIYDVAANNDGTLGLDFAAWKNGPGQLLGATRLNGAYFHTSGGGQGHFNDSRFAFILDYPSQFFDFLVEKGKAQTLTDTTIRASSGRPAVLETVDKVLHYQVSTDAPNNPLIPDVVIRDPQSGAEIATVQSRTVNSETASNTGIVDFINSSTGQPIYKKIGVSLALVPDIGDEVTNIETYLYVSSIKGYQSDGLPILDAVDVVGNQAIQNGKEAVFGGLQRVQTIKRTRKVPILGSLPVLGYLFGGEISSQKKSIIVASIKPDLVQKGAPDVAVSTSDVMVRP